MVIPVHNAIPSIVEKGFGKQTMQCFAKNNLNSINKLKGIPIR